MRQSAFDYYVNHSCVLLRPLWFVREVIALYEGEVFFITYSVWCLLVNVTGLVVLDPIPVFRNVNSTVKFIVSSGIHSTNIPLSFKNKIYGTYF